MKKLLLLGATLLVVTFCANAQLKGDFYVGGNVGIDTDVAFITVSDGYDAVGENAVELDMGIDITVGYFLFDGWRISAHYDAGRNTSFTDGQKQGSYYSDFVGLGLAYYKELAPGLYYVPEIEVGGAWEKDTSTPFSGFSFAISLFQLEYKPTAHFSTSVNIGYLSFIDLVGTTTVDDYSLEITGGMFGCSVGLTPSVTFKYFF